MAPTVGNLHWGDILVIVAYFAAVMAVGIWSSCKNRGSVGGYFLAGRSMHWIPVGASLFASNIGSGHFIGLAGSGAAGGVGIAAFELNAIFVLLFLGWVFAPVYIAAGVFTMPEYLKKRFGGQRIRIYLSVLSLILYVFTKIAADLYAGAVFIQQSLGWNLYLAIIILLLIAALFTIAGGLTAVIWTDFIQTIIMIIGAVTLTVLCFIKSGGYEETVFKFMSAIPNTTRYGSGDIDPNNTFAKCGLPPKDSMHMFRSADSADLPWTGIIFGLTISSVWYWCSDQVIVQRALAAKNVTYSKAGTVLAGYLKFLPLFIIVFPGMIARILYPDEIACAHPDICKSVCNQESGCTNIAYPLIVIRLMPDGVRGLMLAVMMSALMSSLTSIFNSSSTIFTMDVWTRIRKDATDVELMIVGRVFVLVLVGVGIAWIPVVQGFSELFHYIQSVTSFLSPPVCAVYVLAVFWKRTNEKGAFWGLMVGLVVGLTRMIWEFAYGRAPCGTEDKRPAIIKDVHYLHFGILLFGLTAIVAIVISLLTEPIPDKYLRRLTFWDRFNESPPDNISLLGDDELEINNAHKSKQEKEEFSATISPDDNIPDESAAKLPWYRTACNWICGIEKMTDQPHMTEEEIHAMMEKQNSIYEKPLWRRVVNVNAIVLMVAAIFFWGFYN